MRPLLLILLCTLGLTGCVDGTVRVLLLPDGAGSIALDLGYDTKKWPGIFGDPYAGFVTQDQLRRFIEPGMVAWSRPEIEKTGRTRRWRAEVFFDDVAALRFFGRHEGRGIEALGFEPDFARGEIGLRPGFLVYLDDPLPLPSPQSVGMTEVSLSPQLLAAIRQRIRPVIEGLDVRLEVAMPGRVLRADGLDAKAGAVATLRVDADRLGAAFARRAGLLLDEEAVRRPDPRWSWEVPATWNDDAATAFRQRRAAALQWWDPR